MNRRRHTEMDGVGVIDRAFWVPDLRVRHGASRQALNNVTSSVVAVAVGVAIARRN